MIIQSPTAISFSVHSALEFFLLEYPSLSVESLGDVFIFLAGRAVFSMRNFLAVCSLTVAKKGGHLSSFHESGPGRQVSRWWGPSQF